MDTHTHTCMEEFIVHLVTHSHSNTPLLVHINHTNKHTSNYPLSFHQQTFMCINQRYYVKLCISALFQCSHKHKHTSIHTRALKQQNWAELNGRMCGCCGDTDLITFFLFCLTSLLDTSCCIIWNTFFLLKIKTQKLLMCVAS